MWCDRLVNAPSGIFRAFSAIRRSFVETASEPWLSVIWPSDGSSLPALPSLRWVAWVAVPASSLLRSAPTPRRSSRGPCCPMRPRYLAAFVGFARVQLERALHAPGDLLVPALHETGPVTRKRRGLPSSCESPLHARPALGPRWDVPRLALTVRLVLPRLPRLAWLPRVSGLSGLDHTAF